MDSADETNLRILNRCRDMGFALTGIADAAPTEHEQELLDWLAAGKHGEMDYLRRNIELRIDPRRMVPGAKSVICVADRYAATDQSAPFPPPWKGGGQGVGGMPHVTQTHAARVDWNDAPSRTQLSETPDGSTHPLAPSLQGRGEVPAFGRVARYARGDDYHVVMRKRLAKLCKEWSKEFPGETFRACVDTAPVLERELAQRAGLGAIGKNTMLIERGVGSYLLLGEIITTLPLAASRATEPDPCGTCTRCIEACPTSAITPWSVDATRCISYLTIEHRGAIDEQFHSAMGDWIFGCDVCQEVCPHNQETERSRPRMADVHPAYTPRREGFDLLEVLNWNEESRREAFLKSSMKRAKLDMMKRNALIAAGNALRRENNESLSAAIQRIVQDVNECALVRETARTVAQSLNLTHSG